MCEGVCVCGCVAGYVCMGVCMCGFVLFFNKNELHLCIKSIGIVV